MRTRAPLVWLLLSTVALGLHAQGFRGDLTARWRDRWGSPDWKDQDLFTYLRLGFGEEGARGYGGAVSLRWDGDFVTAGNEARDGEDRLRVYYAYADLDKLENFDLRLGQQILDEAEGFTLLGVRAAYRAPWKHLRVGAFAGQPVSWFSAVHHDERAGGLFASLRPDDRSQLRTSWIHLEERASRVEPGNPEMVEQDVVTLSYRRSFEGGSNLWATARTLDFDVWNEVVGGSWQIAPLDVLLTGSYRRQEDTHTSPSNWYGDLSTIIGPSRPYQLLTAHASRPLADRATIGFGWTERRLLDDGESFGSQEYRQLFADLVLTERLLAGFEATANWSRWDTDRDESSTLSGSLGRRFGEHLRFELGSTYAKYDLVTFFDAPDEVPRERYDVRSNYLRGEWRMRRKYLLRADYARTTDSISPDTYSEIGLRVGFDLGFLAQGLSR